MSVQSITLLESIGFAPYVCADCIVAELENYLNEDFSNRRDLADHLAETAERIYTNNEQFAKRLRSRYGLDYLHAFMRHWLSAELVRANAKYRRLIPTEFMNGCEVRPIGGRQL